MKRLGGLLLALGATAAHGQANVVYNPGASYDPTTVFAHVQTLEGEVTALAGTSGQITLSGSTGGTITFGLASSVTGVQLVGITSAITAGNVGEVADAALGSGSAVSTTTATEVTIVSESLTAGNWECSSNLYVKSSGTGNLSSLVAGLNTSGSGSLPTTGSKSAVITFSVGTSVDASLASPPVTELLPSGGTVYLVAIPTYSANTITLYGNIHCKRIG